MVISSSRPGLLGLFVAPVVDRWVERFGEWVEGRFDSR